MAKFPTYEELAKNVAEKALDDFLYDGKSIREWMQIIASEDCISRQAVIDKMRERDEELSCLTVKDVRELPSVNSQSKTGHWIYDDEHSDWFDLTYECSCCKRKISVPYGLRNEVYKKYPYCHCGAKMIEGREK